MAFILRAMSRHLEACYAKVRRAEEQLTNLEGEFWPHAGNDAYREFRQYDREKRQYRIDARIRPESWMRWSVIIGEIAHDLRSALDQSVCIAVQTVRPQDRCNGRGFPIRGNAPATDEDRKTYEATVEHVPPRARAVIDGKQPHTAPTDTMLLDLLDLHRLNKWDKHRSLPLLVRAVVGAWDAGTPEQPLRAFGYWDHTYTGLNETMIPLKDGTDLYTYTFDVPPDMGDDAQVNLVICLDESGPIRRPFIATGLRSMCVSVRRTLDAMEAALA